jgi:subtilase family serine protease
MTNHQATRRPSRANHLEPLEPRQMLSVSAPGFSLTAVHAYMQEVRQTRAHATVRQAAPDDLVKSKRAVNKTVTVVKGKTVTNYLPAVGAYSPVQVRTAYGVTSLATTNQGQGMTIGIVDEYDDSAIISDTNVFSATYGLQQFNVTGGPTLTVYKDTALGSVAASPTSGNGDTSAETSLDVEWAHAMAPMASILLVEVPVSGSLTNEFAQLLHGVQYAAQQGCQAISLSYGYLEASFGSSNVTSLNSTYLSSGAALNTAIFVSSGDSGKTSTASFPATSPNVVAVGGTSLYLASVKGKYSYETAWGGVNGAGAGGGGVSSVFAAPTFQSANGVSYSGRAIPDVSAIADPITGVSYYDSYDAAATNAGDPWNVVGGTSLASPVVAGMVALAQQTRVANGKALLTSAKLTSEIYSLYNSASYGTYFHDVKLGNNNYVSGTTTTTGYAATTGYDLATGVGSPIANTLVPLLATI